MGVKILKFFDADPGWKNSDPGGKKIGSGINIPDPQHWFSLIRIRSIVASYFRPAYYEHVNFFGLLHRLEFFIVYCIFRILSLFV